jgi:hypothetical protein
VRNALDDKLSIVEVFRIQRRINGKGGQLPRIWQYAVFKNLRVTHLKQWKFDTMKEA